MQPDKSTFEIGIIGAGDMGLLYAQRFRKAGWKRINICDIPTRYQELQEQLTDQGYHILPDGYAVSRRSDYIIYSVEAGNIDNAVAQYGRATKVGAIVGGQTSVKTPEIAAFERHLPADVHIVTMHSLHGPNIDTPGQPLVVIRHRCDDQHFESAKAVLDSLKSDMVQLSYTEHDRITADTQAVTHLAFISMGSAWKSQRQYPNVKVNMAIRIYGSKWHVYAGLAILNPFAKAQIQQYVQSVSELYKLMITRNRDAFRTRILEAGKFVFGGPDRYREPILLTDQIMEQFSLGSIPPNERKGNSHLSLLAMVDCWYRMGINPFDHLICQTPPFRLWLGITEYCFKNREILEESMEAALTDQDIHVEDLSCIQLGSFEGYNLRFQDTAAFFQSRFDEGKSNSTAMINLITKKTTKVRRA
ncbi:prephenate dehydrogenase (NADP(+)) [Dimargaris xerosporica]|nr:prephenate dehydrogenase (NADP(+)) [Dimargaris xerosporica]